MSNTWQVHSNGNVMWGKDADETAARLREKLGLSQAQVARLLDGKPKVLKKDLDKHSALKYQAALSSAGLDVTIQPTPRPAEPPAATLSLVPLPGEAADGLAPDEPVAQSRPTRRVEPGEMACPKCQAIQPRAVECRECGVIIAKFNAPAPATAPGAEARTAPPASPALRLKHVALGLAAVALVVVGYFLLSPTPHSYGTTPEAIAQAKALHTAMSHQRPDMARFKGLLESGDYRAAERFIQDLHDRTMRDISWEDYYNVALFDATPKQGFNERLMTNWVDATGSAIAYLARGVHLTMASFEARGTKYAAQTNAAQFEEQARLAIKARRDLERALAMNNRFLPAYSALIQLDTAPSVQTDKRQLLTDAISVAPGTFLVRGAYMHTLLPRWGGSYLQMERLIEASMRYLDHNPRLWALNGAVYGDKADRAWDRKDASKGIELYTKALSFGIDRDWLTYRADLLARTGKRDEARQDIETLLEYFPWDDHGQRMKKWLR